MKKNIKSAIKYGLISAAFLAVAADPALADISTVMQNIKGQFKDIADVMSGVSYLIGIGAGIKAGLKLKEHTESKGQVPLSHAMMYAIVAGILLALPSLLDNSRTGIFGTGTKGTNIDSGVYTSLN